MNKTFRFLLLLSGLLFSIPAWASLSIEGAHGAAWSTGTTLALPAITTTGSGEPIVVLSVQNSGTGISSVTSTHLTFTRRAIASSPDIEEWVALSSSPLTSEVITITYVSAPSYGEACAFGVLGTPSSSYFDTNSSLPVANNTVANPTFSTAAANTLVFGALRFSSTGTPTAGSGWTSIYAPTGGFFLAQYKTFSSAQTGTTVAVGTGSGGENGSIVDAVVQAGSSPGPSPSQFFLAGP